MNRQTKTTRDREEKHEYIRDDSEESSSLSLV